MAKGFATVRDLARRLVHDSPETSKLVREGRREAFKDEGMHSLFAWPFLALARKLKGKAKVNEALYEHLHRPLKNIDEKAGKALAKATGAKKLFGQVDVLPTGRKMGGNHALIEHKTHSATAPISKAVGVVTPLAATLWAADKLMGGENKMANDTTEDKDALLKEASVALEAADRRDKAVKLAFALVERGKVPAFQSFDQFEEKVASLLEKDLRVVEEAIGMDGSLASFGKVAEDRSSVAGDDATTRMFHQLAGD